MENNEHGSVAWTDSLFDADSNPDSDRSMLRSESCGTDLGSYSGVGDKRSFDCGRHASRGRYRNVDEIYAYLRKGEKETLLVVGNFTDQTIDYHIEETVQAKKSRLLISNYNAAETFERDLAIEPYGACVYLLETEE